jgi:toxin ParE1/3/4
VVKWSHQARADLRHVFEFIAHDSPRYASRVVQDITDKAETLNNLPRLGRIVPEIGDETVREIGM